HHVDAILVGAGVDLAGAVVDPGPRPGVVVVLVDHAVGEQDVGDALAGHGAGHAAGQVIPADLVVVLPDVAAGGHDIDHGVPEVVDPLGADRGDVRRHEHGAAVDDLVEVAVVLEHEVDRPVGGRLGRGHGLVVLVADPLHGVAVHVHRLAVGDVADLAVGGV